MKWIAFAREHPFDSSDLMEFVSKTIPEDWKR